MKHFVVHCSNGSCSEPMTLEAAKGWASRFARMATTRPANARVVHCETQMVVYRYYSPTGGER